MRASAAEAGIIWQRFSAQPEAVPFPVVEGRPVSGGVAERLLGLKPACIVWGFTRRWKRRSSTVVQAFVVGTFHIDSQDHEQSQKQRT